MRTGANIKTYKPVMYKPSEAAIVVSERNNDRKFMFLSEETTPDYRPRTAQSHSDSGHDKSKVESARCILVPSRISSLSYLEQNLRAEDLGGKSVQV